MGTAQIGSVVSYDSVIIKVKYQNVLFYTFVKILISNDLCSSEDEDSTFEMTKNINLWILIKNKLYNYRE